MAQRKKKSSKQESEDAAFASQKESLKDALASKTTSPEDALPLKKKSADDALASKTKSSDDILALKLDAERRKSEAERVKLWRCCLGDYTLDITKAGYESGSVRISVDEEPTRVQEMITLKRQE